MDSQLKVYNQDGNLTGELKAPEFLLSHSNPELVHQVYKSMVANKRNPIAHTKDRSEVSGGGKKPWKQKGTGRARQGSIRSPLWRHGGISFGPRNSKDYSQSINKKMAHQALISAMAYAFQIGRLKVLNGISAEMSKTKELARLVRNLSDSRSALLVLPDSEKKINRLSKNLPNVTVVSFEHLNLDKILNNYYLILDQRVLEPLNKKFSYGK